MPKLLTRLFFSTLRSYVVDIVMGRSPGWWCPFWFIDSTLLRMRYDPPTVSLQRRTLFLHLAANENMVLGKNEFVGAFLKKKAKRLRHTDKSAPTPCLSFGNA